MVIAAGGAAMHAIKRPVPVLIVALVYVAVGTVGFAYHFPGLWTGRQGSVWVELSECVAVLAGAFLLRGQNWARWLAVAWIGFHVVLSVFHSYSQTAVHAVIFALIVWALFTPAAGRYFERSVERPT
jgi:hypothetical protein